MNQAIFIGRCECDSSVKFPYNWADLIKEEAEKLEIDIIDLQREDYIEINTREQIESSKPFFVFLNGHGEIWCAKGFNQQPVLIANKNDYLLKDKIAYVVSCYTAQYLGQTAYEKGCKAYIGYEDEFSFVYMNENNPQNDIIAKIFMEASNQVPLIILNGGTAKEAYKKSQEIYKKWIDFWWKRWKGIVKTKLPPKVVGDILVALVTNQEGQRLLTND